MLGLLKKCVEEWVGKCRHWRIGEVRMECWFLNTICFLSSPSLSLSWNCPAGLDWLATRPRDPPPVLALQADSPHLDFPWFLSIEVRSSCLHGKRSTGFAPPVGFGGSLAVSLKQTLCSRPPPSACHVLVGAAMPSQKEKPDRDL